MTDSQQEGIWRWASDESLAGNYSRIMGGLFWFNGNPDNGNGEYCGLIYYGGVADAPCSAQANAICEQPGKFYWQMLEFLYSYRRTKSHL